MWKILNFLSGLVVENGSNKMSLGRISWWIIFGAASKILISGGDITSNHLTILLILAGYNMGKKAIDKFKKSVNENGPG